MQRILSEMTALVRAQFGYRVDYQNSLFSLFAFLSASRQR
jgi:hypothetical protein